MSQRLIGIDAKIERAYEQIEYLNACARDFFGDGARHALSLKFERKQDALPGSYPFRVSGRINGPDPPSRLSILAGEIVHHLRSSLDHLVWQLVIEEGRVPPGRHNEFPIYVSPHEYTAKAPRKIEGVSTNAAALIEREQPFVMGPDNYTHPLMELHLLNIDDKHRMLIPTKTEARYGWPTLDAMFAQGETPPPHPVVYAGGEVNVEGEPTVDVVIDQGARTEALIPYLQVLADFTRATISNFRGEFR